MIIAFLCLAQSSFALEETVMTDEEFFRKVNLDYPGLERVREAVEAADLDAARREIAEYYRTRSGKFYLFDAQEPGDGPEEWLSNVPSTKPLTERTDEFGKDLWKGDCFDWNASKVRNKERMYLFGSIGKAYAASGDERIARAWVNLMRSFVKGCSLDEGGSMWASMNAGIRMRSGWPEAFHCFIKSPSFGDEDLIVFLKSVWQQSDYIKRKHDPTSNWLTFCMAGLYTSGVMYPEFADAEDWRRYASNKAVEDMDVGWLPDGMSIELTPGYGQFFSNYYTLYDTAEKLGRLDEFNLKEFPAKTEGPYELYMKVMTPDRLTPATNDNGPQDVVSILTNALGRFPEREDFRWIVTDGKEGHAPEFTSIALPYAGFAAMRSGWGRDDNMLYFDFGPVGYRHVHQDKLELMLWAYGRQVLFDPGRMNYADTPHQRYCMDTFSHNTVLVDNRPQRRLWYENPPPDQRPYKKLTDYQWETTDKYDHAAGVYAEAYGLPGASEPYPYKEGSNFREGWGHPAVHHRRVLFLKPDVFIVADTLIAKDDRSHEYDVRWHLDSVRTRKDEKSRSVATTDPDAPNLEIVPLVTQGIAVKTTSAQNEPEILGWKVAQTSEPATTVQHVKSGAGKVRFLALLLPLKAGQAGLFESCAQAGDGAWKIRLSDGRKLNIKVPEDHTQKLTGRWE